MMEEGGDEDAEMRRCGRLTAGVVPAIARLFEFHRLLAKMKHFEFAPAFCTLNF
jgi:hypothetical protein